ncbi:transporter [Sphingobium yanoikuyae]|uniref:transporter n=1 Tax=Sphingobium yanoikuyae TaxID=13690 RepID=UPI0028AD9EC6|nr:transporter [Sphingobium yanoikuyae]
MAYHRMALKTATLVAAGWLTQEAAQARDITFAVIGPSEYDLPTDGFRAFDALVQYGFYDAGAKQFDNEGQRVRAPDTDLVVGLTKYVHFWTFDGLPDVGFAMEVIQPTVHVATPTSKTTGFGDTIIGPAIWVKPTKGTTLGIQSFMSVPIGSDGISNRYWANMTSILFHANLKGGVKLTGDVGGVFRGRQDVDGGPDVKPGNSYHANVRLSYRPGETRWEPYLAFDWQRNNRSRAVSGPELPLTEGHDVALGAGIAYALNDKLKVAGRYSRSVSGRNVVTTNAFYFSIAKTF